MRRSAAEKSDDRESHGRGETENSASPPAVFFFVCAPVQRRVGGRARLNDLIRPDLQCEVSFVHTYGTSFQTIHKNHNKRNLE